MDGTVLGAAYTVTSEDLAPIMDAITSNAAVIVPVGVGIVAIIAGLRFIPKLVKMFTRG